MNKLFVLAVGLVAVGVLVGMAVLQAPPTPSSVKLYTSPSTGQEDVVYGGWPITVPFVPSASGNYTGISLRLRMSSGVEDYLVYELRATTKCVGSTLGIGVARVTVLAYVGWYTIGSFTSPGGTVAAGASCSAMVEIFSGPDGSRLGWARDTYTATKKLVVWGSPAPASPTPPAPTGPTTTTNPTGGEQEEGPPPGEGIDPMFLLVAVVLVVGGFALILIRR